MNFPSHTSRPPPAATLEAPLAQLVVPPLMPLLKQEDYTNIRFWTKEGWLKFEEKRNRGGNTLKNSKMDFLSFLLM